MDMNNLNKIFHLIFEFSYLSWRNGFIFCAWSNVNSFVFSISSKM